MNNFVKKMISRGISKSDINIFSENEIDDIRNILQSLKKKYCTKGNNDFGHTLSILGKDTKLDNYIEKIFSNQNVIEHLESILGKSFLMRRPLVRFSGKKDTGLYVHQDAIGQSGLFFLIDEQKTGTTIVLKGSHLFPMKSQIVNFMSWNSVKLLKFTKFFLSAIEGKKGESFFWFQRLFHGRKPSEGDEKITIFFTFMPRYKEESKNIETINKFEEENKNLIPNLNNLNLPSVKKLMDKRRFIFDTKKERDLPLCLKLNEVSFFIKNITYTLSPTLKLLILELIFFPIYLIRIIKKFKKT